MMNDSNSEDIFFKRKLTPVATSSIFDIIEERDGIRVKNENVACYFKNINAQEFESAYNEYLSALNLNFSSLNFDGIKYELSKHEQSELLQKIITSHIYFYTVNNLAIVIKRSDFLNSFTIDQVIWLLDKKLKLKHKDTKLSLAFGAHLLRQDLKTYMETVKGRRFYFDR